MPNASEIILEIVEHPGELPLEVKLIFNNQEINFLACNLDGSQYCTIE